MIPIEEIVFSNRVDEFMAYVASREPKMEYTKKQIQSICDKIGDGERLLFSERLVIQRMIYWVMEI
ncbi:hypothetical protein LCGC14_1889050 [marine sediment metagenome]|uniref:Uncharacterized protein n=1 Tax=marine sediment metagenome TaxID=412755 RepID=A0A0F9GN68_9ZZZZ